ncbi:MAG TPA: hypothetical protein VER98_09365 [Terriglobia bacterium]|nr:hypothetical protein [Terriglobia bacterium]
MDLNRLGIKFFAATKGRIHLAEFIPVFHEWIQKQIIKDHLLIDTHNYSHMHEGPGILLVAHQGNFSIDTGDDRMGLLYYRKEPADTLADIVKPAVQGCGLLEEDPRMRGRLNFRTDEVLFVANDRLLAPNNDETFSQFEPRLSAALNQVLGKPFKLSRISDDPKERLTIRARN